MKPTDFNVVADVSIRRLDDDVIDQVMDALVDYAGVISRAPDGRTQVTITLPAVGLRQAITTALSVIDGAVAPATVTAVEAMTTKEFDARSEALEYQPVPELVSISEAAAAMDVSRQAVHQRIESGSLPATRVGSTWVIPKSTLEQVLRATEGVRLAAPRLDIPVPDLKIPVPDLAIPTPEMRVEVKRVGAKAAAKKRAASR